MIIDTLGLFFHIQCFKVLHYSSTHLHPNQGNVYLILLYTGAALKHVYCTPSQLSPR